LTDDCTDSREFQGGMPQLFKAQSARENSEDAYHNPSKYDLKWVCVTRLLIVS